LRTLHCQSHYVPKWNFDYLFNDPMANSRIL
jgi:hypothetical protein